MVASQAMGFPSHQGISDTPSGLSKLLPSNPEGARVVGTPADEKLLAIILFIAACLALTPGDFLQTKACDPSASTAAPHLQACGRQILSPSLRATATRMASLSNLSPHDAIGRAVIQAPEFGAWAAKKIALSRVDVSLVEIPSLDASVIEATQDA